MSHFFLSAILAIALTLPISSTAQTAAGLDLNNLKSFPAPSIQRTGYVRAQLEKVAAERFVGQRVYSPKDAWVGVINALLTDSSGQIAGVVINVGGFLGMSEKPVAITLSSITVAIAETGGDIRFYLGATDAQLTALPAFGE